MSALFTYVLIIVLPFSTPMGAGLIDLHTMVLSDGTTRGNATAEAIEQASLKWATAYREVRVHKSYWRVSFATLSDEVCALPYILPQMPSAIFAGKQSSAWSFLLHMCRYLCTECIRAALMSTTVTV